MSRPSALLFACNLNSIRSPMAAALARKRLGGAVHVESCGVWEGGFLDPLMVEVMKEVGADMAEHAPRTFDDLEDSNFDVIVALTPQAFERASTFARSSATDVEFVEIGDPTEGAQARAARLAAYRGVRDALDAWIQARFDRVSTKPGS